MYFCKIIQHTDDHGNLGIEPVFKTKGAACADVAIPSRTPILAHSTAKIDLLISFDIPEGYKVVMYPRSSLLVKLGIMQPVSIIDSDYKGHVHVPLHNLTNSTIFLEQGERVAQIECVPAPGADTFENVAVENAERDQNGFGGTGRI